MSVRARPAAAVLGMALGLLLAPLPGPLGGYQLGPLVGTVGLVGAGSARAAGCDVQISLVDFGALDFEKGEDVAGELRVACDAPVVFKVTASRGFGDYSMRRMRGPDGTELRYNLYVDPARRRVWGDGTGGTVALAGQVDGRRPVTFAIYGFVPGGQRVRQGPYSDAVTVALER